jgi:ribonuclease T1
VLVNATPGRRTAVVLIAVVLALAALTGCGRGSTSAPTDVASPTGGAGASVSPSDAASLAPATPVSGLAAMTVAQLPKEGVTTLRLIASGGPFPYSKDGVTFSNREALLPQHPSGWYQEYTVITPGSSDRGARRIIAGKDGGRFYTSDHYASFREVLSGVSS